MVKYLLSSFNPNMIDSNRYATKGEEITEEEFNQEKVGAIAVINHPAFARILQVPLVKKYIRLHPGDVALVVGTDGGKLDYQATSLPEGLSLKFNRIEILEATV